MLQAWGDAGLCRHVEDMQRSYARRASVIVAAADEHLKDVASWRAPQVWCTLYPRTPSAGHLL
jgi:DNA-binding transcriptional MocR family regulator